MKNNKLLVMGISLILMILINFLAVTLPLNGRSTQSISDSYQIFFVPAGYVFSIWGLIYITQTMMFVKLLTQAKKYKELIEQIGGLFILANFANAVWLFFWHYLQINLSVVTMLVLLVSLIMIYTKVKKFANNDKVLTIPSGIYLGWICVATVANITAALWVAKWDGFGIEPQIWAGIMIIVASVLAFLMIELKREFSYAAVILWAIVGIAVKFNNESTILLATLAGASIILLGVLQAVSTESANASVAKVSKKVVKTVKSKSTKSLKQSKKKY